VGTRSPDLLFDEKEIVEKPFSRRWNTGLPLDRFGQDSAGGCQLTLVIHQAGQQSIRASLLAYGVLSSESSCMALHLLAAVQLRAQGALF
jgi:hypothetical protein